MGKNKQKSSSSKNKKIFLGLGISLVVIILVTIACILLFNKDEVKYNVTFESNGGTVIESLTIDEDNKINRPEDPVKQDYIFVGWYYEDELYDFTKPVTGNIKLEAKWEKLEKVSGIKVEKTKLNLEIGQTTTLVATVIPENASNKKITWESNDPNVVNIDEKGNIKALKEGKTTITVTTEDGGHTSTIQVEVISKKAEQVESNNLVSVQTKNEYTVTFVDTDGTKLSKTQIIKKGSKVIEPESPTKYGHVFQGWYNGNTKYTFDEEIKTNVTLTAKWTKNKYTVTFVNEDGTVLETQTVEYGEKPKYAGKTPVKSGNEKYTFVFSTWSPRITSVKKDVTYTATFKTELTKYKITFVNEDGTVLQTLKVEYGKLPKYTGKLPTKASNAQYTYIFTGWNTNLSEVEKDATYTATYASILNSYTVNFMDEDGKTLLDTQKVVYGNKANKPEEPKKEGHTFAGWYNGNTKYTFDEEIKTNVKLTAKWTKNKYTVTFKNEDGTILETQTLEYGSVPVYAGKTPTKVSTEKFKYTFAGWSSNIMAVKEDVTYTATFKEEYIDYVIKFVDEDGTVIKESTYHYGETVILPASPVKEADSQYTYIFAGWNPGVTLVEKDATYTATYTTILNRCTVDFIDEDGKVLSDTQEVEYGNKAVEPVIPTKEGHTFAGWYNGNTKYTFDEEIKTNVTLTAKWTKNKYTVTFKNEDGTILETQTVEYGNVPVYAGKTPTKAGDSQYTYTFVGWDPSVLAVKENVTYTAVYKTSINKYTVKYVDESGEVLADEQILEYGSVATIPSTPKKEGHTFAGWYNGNTKYTFEEEIKTNITLTAKWIKNKYTIIFKDIDGTVLETKVLEYGEKPKYTGETPIKAADTQYTYTFAGWDSELTEVQSDKVYTVKYNKTVNKYTVIFKNEDGTVLETKTVEYGIIPNYTGKTPTKISDAQYTYTFVGWNPLVTMVQGDITYIATFKSDVRKYTIKFVDEDGKTLSDTQKVEYGNKVVEPVVPTKEGCIFEGWYNGNTKYTFEEEIKSDITLTAKWTKKKYTVTFKNEDGTVLETKTLEYGTLPEYTGETPTKVGDAQYTYTFVGWEPEITSIRGDITYTAKYKQSINKYKVTFVYEDGMSSPTSQKVQYGDKVTVPKEPTKKGHTFEGWYNGDTKYTFEEAIKSDITLTAKWSKNKYTITFANDDGTVLQTQILEYGEKPKYTGETPTKADTEQYTYVFGGWDSSLVPAKEDVTYTVVYVKRTREYSVTFLDEDGKTTLCDAQKVEYGSQATKPVNPTKKGHTFVGWYNGNTKYTFNEEVKSDVKLKAEWEAIKYKIRFINYDNSALETIMVDYGKTPKYTGRKPYKPSDGDTRYVFIGWETKIRPVTSNATYRAEFARVMDIEKEINSMVSKFKVNEFELSKDKNNINIKFVAYSTKTPPYKFMTFFFEVAELFHLLSCNINYESVELYYKHPGDTAGKTIDLKDYDLTDTAFGSWYGDGANDKVGDWVGYLASGTASTTAALNADSSNLVGKKVKVTVTLKDGYAFDDGSKTIDYYLTFDSE